MERTFDLPRYLAVLPLFQEMTPPELQRLAAGCRLRRLGRGDPVFRVGEPCEEFHVTVMGQVKLYAISPAGQEKVIELIGPGNSFAEALMFTGKPYIINAQALTDTLLLSVGKAVVFGEIERDPRFAMRMLAGISRRLHGQVVGQVAQQVADDALHAAVSGARPRARAARVAAGQQGDHRVAPVADAGVLLARAARAGGGRADHHRQARDPHSRHRTAGTLPDELSRAEAPA